MFIALKELLRLTPKQAHVTITQEFEEEPDMIPTYM